VVRAVVYLNRHRIEVRRGRNLRVLILSHLPHGSCTLTIVTTTRRGVRARRVRKIHCTKGPPTTTATRPRP
jgi:hypothetical protein